ncbi:MAG: START domain-containing protein [Bdellovibrionota bacterium]
MKRLLMPICVILSLVLSVSSNAAINAEWKKIKNRKGVDVFEGVIANSPVVAFRGVSVIDAPIGKVVSVIHDVSRIKEWMSDLAGSRVLERKSVLEKIEYNHTKTPWPLDDRDFVYSVKVVINKEEKSVDILVENATHPDAPPVKGIVRGTLHSSRYYLKSIDNGTRTHIEVEVLADPNGNIPKWVVNLFQSAWPSNTVAGIGKIATETGYQIHPDITPFLVKTP